MFDMLRRFMADITSETPAEGSLADDDVRVATAALLVHVAHVDGKFEPAERTRLREVIEHRFGLDAAATTRLIERGEEQDREAVDFFHFTSVLKRNLDDDGRHRIIAMLWDVVFADGEISEFEENVVWRIAELLGVPNRDRILLREQAAGTAPSDAAAGASGASGAGPAGPWSGMALPTPDKG